MDQQTMTSFPVRLQRSAGVGWFKEEGRGLNVWNEQTAYRPVRWEPRAVWVI